MIILALVARISIAAAKDPDQLVTFARPAFVAAAAKGLAVTARQAVDDLPRHLLRAGKAGLDLDRRAHLLHLLLFHLLDDVIANLLGNLLALSLWHLKER